MIRLRGKIKKTPILFSEEDKSEKTSILWKVLVCDVPSLVRVSQSQVSFGYSTKVSSQIPERTFAQEGAVKVCVCVCVSFWGGEECFWEGIPDLEQRGTCFSRQDGGRSQVTTSPGSQTIGRAPLLHALPG